ncbi:MAG: choice-of-anchor J domain-containing protein [Dokdonella sp.]
MKPAASIISTIAFALVSMALPRGSVANPAVTCSEGFNDVAQLRAQGWLILNRSDPLGSTNWFQGIPARFPAQAGASDSYASADMDNASGQFPVISDWLITPDIQFFDGNTLDFYTRELAGANDAPNRLQVLLCMDGGSEPCTDPGPESGDLGGFQTTLFDINADGDAGGYPAAWTEFTATAALGMPQSGSGRIAIHFYTFAQGASNTGTTIGVDSVALSQVAVCPFADVIFANGFDGN